MAVSKTRVALTLLVVAIAAGAIIYALRKPPPTEPAEPAASVAASAPSEGPASVAASVASGPASSAKLDLPATQAPMAAADVEGALGTLLGRDTVLKSLQTDDFAHRFAATIDSLGRGYTAAKLWPVNPTPGRFAVEQRDGATVIASANAERYAAFVGLTQHLDAGAAADLYLRLYPLLQAAYEGLGFPDRYFNDRLLEVIDSLLAAPEPSGPIALDLLEVKEGSSANRPWVRYRFADPELEALPAGQKILVRMGRANERSVKAKLREIRQQLAAHQVKQ